MLDLKFIALAAMVATISLPADARKYIEPYEITDSFELHAKCMKAFMTKSETAAQGYSEGFCEGIAMGAVTAWGLTVRDAMRKDPRSKLSQCLDSELRKFGSDPRRALMESIDDGGKEAATPEWVVYKAMGNRLFRLCESSK